MKKYIGTKEVSATPAWRIDGKVYPKDGPVPRSMNREDGYKVVYEDGYESWSPKDVFEKAYKVADTFLDRLHIEQKDVMSKYYACDAFINSDKFREIVKDDYAAFLLSFQRELLWYYMGTLSNRMALAQQLNCSDFFTYKPISIAIHAMNLGYAVRRSHWDNKNLVVIKQVPAHIEGDIIPKMQSLSNQAKDLIGNGKNCIDYKDQCLLYNRETGEATSWSPSTEDLFAKDWRIVFE